MKTIPTYVINLKKRTDRKSHILKEFAGRTEFYLHIIVVEEGEIAPIELWNTIKYILRNLVSPDEEYIIVCQDDHSFTEDYRKELLFKAIIDAQKREAAILMGGVSWFDTALQISPDLFVVDKFSGSEFTVIFRKFFNTILETEFGPNDVFDYKISALTEDKLVMYPFISTQKEFDCSNVRSKNNNEAYVVQMPSYSSATLKVLNDVALFYELDVVK